MNEGCIDVVRTRCVSLSQSHTTKLICNREEKNKVTCTGVVTCTLSMWGINDVHMFRLWFFVNFVALGLVMLGV